MGPSGQVFADIWVCLAYAADSPRFLALCFFLLVRALRDAWLLVAQALAGSSRPARWERQVQELLERGSEGPPPCAQ